METFVNIIDTEVIDYWRNQKLTPEDYNDTLDQPEFLRINLFRSKWGTQEEIELPDDYEEIELYDNSKCFDENFEIGNTRKYILIEVNKNEHFTIKNPESVLPTPNCRCVIDIRKVEKYSHLEFITIDHDNFFGLRLLSFNKYKSDFLICDERVLFEALLIKFKSFDFKPFFWSNAKIFEEIGIKKDRLKKILHKFSELGILSSKEVKKSFINNRPGQITYFDLDADKIIELTSRIFKERDNLHIESKIREYLSPAISRSSFSKMQ